MTKIFSLIKNGKRIDFPESDLKKVIEGNLLAKERGNWGHAGVPGQRGGSAPKGEGGGGSENDDRYAKAKGESDKDYQSRMERVARERYPRTMKMDELYRAHDQVTELTKQRDEAEAAGKKDDAKTFQADIDRINANRVEPGQQGAYDLKVYRLPDDVRNDGALRAYIGKPNTCMCGCAGNYFETKLGLKGMKDDDYRKDNKAQEDKVDRIFNKMEKLAGTRGVEVILDDSGKGEDIFTAIADSGATQYTIYKAASKMSKAVASKPITKQDDTVAEGDDTDLFNPKDFPDSTKHDEKVKDKTKKEIIEEGRSA